MPLLLSQPHDMFATNTTSFTQGVDPSKAPQAAVQPLDHYRDTSDPPLPHIDFSYDNDNSEASVRALVYKIQPKWRETPNELEFTKFTDGITNTLLRVARRRPGATQNEVDDESILMRAYGNNTDLIIDRDREARSHALLAQKDMAPPLFARFNNGLLYQYIPGKVCTPDDLTREEVWRGVARKLAEWHARVPISAVSSNVLLPTNNVNGYTNGHLNGHANGTNGTHLHRSRSYRLLESRSPEPNIWSVLQKYVDTLPVGTDKERARKELLQHEVERTFRDLDTKQGIGERGLVFGHLDLLSGNVIVLPAQPGTSSMESSILPVTFIDYEYATPCPAAYDIANHFAEWAGFDLDYNRLPTKSVRRAFLAEYVESYNKYTSIKLKDSIIDTLDAEVNRWRGIPGLYWGIWALIQAKISEIDFDYAQYAEERLEEYWSWRAETDGSRASNGKAVPLRERRWAQEI